MDALIIDDDEMCLLILSHAIQLSKFTENPKSFNSAQKGLDFLNGMTDRSQPVVIFLDINMPEMNGWEFLDLIHELHTDTLIFVVVVTSSVSIEDESRARSYPMVIDFVVKPFPVEVLQKIKNLIS